MSSTMMAADVVVTRHAPGTPPAHHVYDGASSAHRTGFCNPWDSWHKPSLREVTESLAWGERLGCKAPAWVSAVRSVVAGLGAKSGTTTPGDVTPPAPPLAVQKPDFAFDAATTRARATWLGHASVLVQLAGGTRPMRILFDPLFSARCSPTQWLGPVRFFPAPCGAEAMPALDLVVISHNHYDHLDYDSIAALWHAHAATVHFFVPLGNKAWFLEHIAGLRAERVHELDWWDEATVVPTGGDAEGPRLRIVCTPAQHGSGRTGTDACKTLWASWMLEHALACGDVYRVFFGGDSGFRLQPGRGGGARTPDARAYPACPAFEAIATRIGAPDLSMLPVSVGATYAFLKSFDPLPDWMSPVPRLDDGVTGAIHMSAADAVAVFTLMGRAGAAARGEKSAPRRAPVCVAIHWGTFVDGPGEVVETMCRLRAACDAEGVHFTRGGAEEAKSAAVGSGTAHEHAARGDAVCTSEPTFAMLDHGQSVWVGLAGGQGVGGGEVGGVEAEPA
ncbi:N-acetylphosphatidylethanolamine-hydrolyzing phospholipase D [Malassezia sp. CBS 17886]|nr:N-acetylphosphatidylethanolamine-hydrolyzing phospholipase D [Malassezia sp. CBS 17886]